MKHCPKCFAEFEDWVDHCSDCGAALAVGTSRRPEEMTPITSMDDLNDFVCVGECESMFEAQALKSALVTEGILHIMVVPMGGASENPLARMERGWWEIRVSESDAVRARHIVDEARRDLASVPPRPSAMGDEDPDATPIPQS